jgi:hypothetical protein
VAFVAAAAPGDHANGVFAARAYPMYGDGNALGVGKMVEIRSD